MPATRKVATPAPGRRLYVPIRMKFMIALLVVTTAVVSVITFTMANLGVNETLKPRSVRTFTFTATKVGVSGFMCDVAEHDPFMWGEVVVLPASAA